MPRGNPSPRADDYRTAVSSLAPTIVARDHRAMEFSNPSDAEIREILARPDHGRCRRMLRQSGARLAQNRKVAQEPRLQGDSGKSSARCRRAPQCSRREVLPGPRIDSRAGRDGGRVQALGVRAANRRGGHRQRCAHPLVPTWGNPPRRSAPRPTSRPDSRDGSMPRDRIRAPLLRRRASSCE